MSQREERYHAALQEHEALIAIHKRRALIDRAVRSLWPEDADFRLMPRSGVSWNGGFKIREWAEKVQTTFIRFQYAEDLCDAVYEIGWGPVTTKCYPAHIDIPQPPSRT